MYANPGGGHTPADAHANRNIFFYMRTILLTILDKVCMLLQYTSSTDIHVVFLVVGLCICESTVDRMGV